MPKFKLHKADYEVLKAIFAKDDTELCVVKSQVEIEALLKQNGSENIAIISTQKFRNAKAFSAICNPDGTIRWLFNSNRKRAGFLGLYNANNFKGKLFKWLVKLLYLLGLKSLVKHGSFYVSVAEDSLCRKLEKSFGNQYSVFTGTVGPNRKLVIESIKEKQAFITKVPLSEKGEKLVENEAKILFKICLPEKLMVVPRMLETDIDLGLCVSNIEPESKDRVWGLSTLHIKAMQAFYKLNSNEEKFEQGDFFKKLEYQFEQLERQSVFNNELNKVVKLLIDLKQRNNLEHPHKTSLMHGDFTPWNMFVSKDKLHVYDWELAVGGSPVFLDLIHYVFQNGVMVKQQKALEILDDLKNLVMNLQAYLPEWGLSFNQLLTWYLLFYGSYYANIYAAQGELHYQAQNLLIVWEEVINGLLGSVSVFPKMENAPVLRVV